MSSDTFYTITEVERDTGLTKDMLRKWELRFGFPVPVRVSRLERRYSASDLERLMVIKRLLDTGMRAGDVVPMPLQQLRTLASQRPSTAHNSECRELADVVLASLKTGNDRDVRELLAASLTADGLGGFVLTKAAPLCVEVGLAWERGEIAVYHEHLYTEVLRNLLAEAIGKLPLAQDSPSFLIATPPEERHDIGAAMLQAVLTLVGIHCISLGREVPASALAEAATAFNVNVVAVSFSIAYPYRRISTFLGLLKKDLPEDIGIWAGGAGYERLKRKPQGIASFKSLELAAVAGRAMLLD
jgi:DNA-binding transcriptional MerR regulator/methylmalonyl-CoA mutase cobalamin-binding subunit